MQQNGFFFEKVEITESKSMISRNLRDEGRVDHKRAQRNLICSIFLL
jgi:hypothetical protein